MKLKSILLFLLPVVVMPLLAGCGDAYQSQISRLAEQYNSARDVVDQTIQAANSASTLSGWIKVATQGVSNLERAIDEMNDAYKDFGNQIVPSKYQDHQQATLSAWRAGIEASTAIKLYLELVLAGEPDESIVLWANRLFAEEDRYQLEARRALQSAR